MFVCSRNENLWILPRPKCQRRVCRNNCDKKENVTNPKILTVFRNYRTSKHTYNFRQNPFILASHFLPYIPPLFSRNMTDQDTMYGALLTPYSAMQHATAIQLQSLCSVLRTVNTFVTGAQIFPSAFMRAYTKRSTVNKLQLDLALQCGYKTEEKGSGREEYNKLHDWKSQCVFFAHFLRRYILAPLLNCGEHLQSP
jgi:hypothetical protein